MADNMPGERLYDVFLIYSNEDRDNARNVAKSLKEKGKKVCIHEDDFQPGVPIIKNITTAITESRKYVVMLSTSSRDTGMYEYEVETSLFNSLITGKKGAIIPFVIHHDADIPLNITAYSSKSIKRYEDEWLEKLIAAIEEPITFRDKDFPRENDYTVISLSHVDSDFRNSPMSDALKELEQKVQRLQQIEVAEDEGCLRYMKERGVSSIKALEKIIHTMDDSPTVLILWICKMFQKDKTCTGFLKSLLLLLKDRRKSPVIIPVQPENSKRIDLIDDITYLPIKPGLQEGEGTEEFKSCFMKYVRRACADFPNSSHELSGKAFDTRSDRDIFRVSEIEGVFENEKSPRYLGVSFTGDGHLLLLDADNECLKKVSILGFLIKKLHFKEMPNRLSRVDDDHVALIYRDTFKILIIDTVKMDIDETREIHDKLSQKATLKGITALDKDTMVVTSSSKKSSLNIGLVKRSEIQENEIEVDLDGNEFSMPRRLTKLDKNTIAIADENDRRLVLIEYHGDSGTSLKVVFAQKRWNKNLFNVRGLTADSEVIYVAACNGVNTFDIKSKELSDEPLIRFRSNVLHTRALALYSSPYTSRKYLAVSVAKQGPPVKEIIKVFDITK